MALNMRAEAYASLGNGKKCPRGSYPFQITIVVYTHHTSSAQPGKRKCGNNFASVRPEIEDPDFELRGAEGSFNGGNEAHALLEEVIATALGRNSQELSVSGIKLDALACEGKERLKEKARINRIGGWRWERNTCGFKLSSAWAGEEIAQENGWRNDRVGRSIGLIFRTAKKWDGEFAYQEVPVGVTRPFNIPWALQVELQLDVAGHEFVGDGAIVDAGDGNAAATGVAVGEARAFRLD
jgi:hypothetical protein